MSITIVRIILVVSGLICIFVGFSFHLGHFRKPIVYWTTFSSGIYATAPLGVSLLFLGLMTWFPYPEKVGIWLMSFSFLFLTIGIILGLTMPQFVTPWWFRFLRREYEEWDILHILMKDATKDYSGWKKRTSTLEGLKAWADEVHQKTKLE